MERVLWGLFGLLRRGTGRDVEEATRERPRGRAHREQSGWSWFFILFSGSGCNLNLQRARLQDFSFFSFNIFFKHPIMDVACASFWTLIMRK